MSTETVQYHVLMDQRTFRNFAAFDTFILKKRARLPIIFFLIMAAFATVAFVSGRPQSGLLGAVLLIVGLGMPVMYALTFLSQVKKKGQALKLDKPKPVYTLTLTDSTIHIHNDLRAEEDVELKWNQLYRVIRRRDCYYMYAVPQKAFILPDSCADCGKERARAFMEARLSEIKGK